MNQDEALNHARAALEKIASQNASNDCSENWESSFTGSYAKHSLAEISVIEPMATFEQEPVAKIVVDRHGDATVRSHELEIGDHKLFARPQPSADDTLDAPTAYQKWMHESSVAPKHDDKRNQFESFLAGFAAALKGKK